MRCVGIFVVLIIWILFVGSVSCKLGINEICRHLCCTYYLDLICWFWILHAGKHDMMMQRTTTITNSSNLVVLSVWKCQYRPAREPTCGQSRFLNGGIWMCRGCIFCRACSGRGRGRNCCRLYTLSLLLNLVPREMKYELLPPPIHSFTWRDSNGDPRGEPAGYGLQQGVHLWVHR